MLFVTAGSLMLALGSGCSSTDGVQQEPSKPLRIGADGSVSVAFPAPRSVYTDASVALCRLSTEPATLVSLSAPAGSDLRVTDFDVVKIGSGFSSEPKPLSSIKRWESLNRVVNDPCGTDADELLAIEYTKDASADEASAKYFTLTYQVDGEQFEDQVKFAVKICTKFAGCKSS
ncbi:MAG: hypothetical protein Q7T73_03400 [Beijerinckiaceae bacterium]|nr:hypothetical protein [Beijerinckiaceae bacterium]